MDVLLRMALRAGALVFSIGAFFIYDTMSRKNGTVLSLGVATAVGTCTVGLFLVMIGGGGLLLRWLFVKKQ